jgi:CubicO group peptidase (beta-lactamase class C family)|tara:strand:- start:1070 stop:2347 length:1278 start_codon:yes stop_codon:yes gene_type:complete
LELPPTNKLKGIAIMTYSYTTRLMRYVFVASLVFVPAAIVGAEDIPQSRIDAATAAIQGHVDAGRLAGAVVLVAQHGKVRKLAAMGHQDLENKVPMQTDTIFRIFSMTKPIAGAALMVLHDEGRFKLSDPVEKYIPEFAGLQVAKEDGPDGKPVTEPPAHKMTIRELMSHSGGLTYGFFSQSQVDSLYVKANVLDRNSTLKQMIAKLAKIPLWAQPGTTWHYSISVDVQGYLVEVLSGMSFDEYLEEKIFTPLGMSDTAFHVPPAKASRLSRYYMSRDGQLSSEANGEYLQKPALFSGGGGLVSTAEDYMRFAQMHLNGGEIDGVRILSDGAVHLMRSRQVPEDIGGLDGFVDPGNTFGLDFAIVNDSSKAYEQTEGVHWWFGVAGTWFWIDPVNEFIFIGMIQTRNVFQAIGLHRETKRLIYGS